MANSIGDVLISGEKTVASAATAEAIVASPTIVKSVTIIGKTANTGQVYLGASDVDSATNDGLDADEFVSISAPGGFDLADIFIDVDTNGEGVDFYAISA